MLPNLANAVRAWMQQTTIERVTKSIINYQLTETVSSIAFQGVVAPLKQTDLEIKPEGQRQWRWYEIHSVTDLAVDLDDLIVWRGVGYRVLAVHNWQDYGYYRYEIAEAFVGAIQPPTYALFIPLGSDKLVTAEGLTFKIKEAS